MRKITDHQPGGERAQTPLPVYDLTPFTMLDFPDQCAAIIWFSGCNMRCPYCHNPQIVRGKGRKKMDDVLTFLDRRKALLDGVVLSGGEATIYPGLCDLADKLKTMGYAIKLDTNGTRPQVIRELLDRELLDYIALDYKSPPEKARLVTGADHFVAFEQTLDMLCTQDRLAFEIRTTVHTGLMDESDISAIIHDLGRRGYGGAYYVQNYTDRGGGTLGGLSAQKRALDLHALPPGDGFSVLFRNFPPNGR